MNLSACLSVCLSDNGTKTTYIAYVIEYHATVSHSRSHFFCFLLLRRIYLSSMTLIDWENTFHLHFVATLFSKCMYIIWYRSYLESYIIIWYAIHFCTSTQTTLHVIPPFCDAPPQGLHSDTDTCYLLS